ncbi:hypothetical protein DL764_000499 [Monosporascus ibericus]|uniref:RING-type domain-containing protein n=1 Tax=Monosporascus ibericus TaxID=155417 RepID=A0A4V1XCR9_9PEZI|nr:hypothetical protein DL764_000499 [Monosporascus ibericus]
MATVQTSNYLPDIQHLLDIQGKDDAVALEVVCACCRQSKLDVSRSARYQKLGAERTVALPCGHVVGDRCVTRMFIRTPPPVACPICEYKMIYVPCGHFIAPALIPVNGNDPVRDRFPLTIPEGGNVPSACKECRWRTVQSKLRFVLVADCGLCRQRAELEMPYSEAEHEAHRAQHRAFGLKDTLAGIMELVWPDFVTRETGSSADKATADADRRQATLSLLVAMALSEVEDTVWYRTPARKPSGEVTRRNAAAVNSIEKSLLSWLMGARDDSRHTW